MKTGFNKTFWQIFVVLELLTFVSPTHAIGMTIATYFALEGIALYATAFAINMAASAIINKAFFSPPQPGSTQIDNPGNRQQLPPATDNKLPVVYGEAWVGGTIVDLSISSNNQELYYVIAICETTNDGADSITFGDVYWGGKKCVFASGSSPDVTQLIDQSTGTTDSSISGKLQIYLYPNGSNSTPVRGSSSAISVMQTSGLTYTWDSSKLMSNTAFAIVHITYNTDAGTTGLQQTKFNVINSRYAPGDCFYDYLTNTVYGAAIPVGQIDTTSLTALNTYCAQSFTYTPSTGGSATQARFRFDGVLDTTKSVMDNLQDMAASCNCLLRYNELTSQWGVVVQEPTYSIAMALDDSNMVSAISISPLDAAASYNYIEARFANKQNLDAFDTVDFDLAQIDPSLLYQNEPVTKFSVTLPLVNNSVRAQYIATRLLKAGREDLQVQVAVNFSGLQLEAGDIVTITNSHYGWVAKEFRVNKVTQEFSDNGVIVVKLILNEFNPAVYDDTSITEFAPLPNTGLPDPLVFGSIPIPIVSAQYPTAATPLFLVDITASSQGIIQYAELWYSAFSSPTASQLIFAGTSEIQPSGNPYDPGSVLPSITLANIPAGKWYFFSRMVNSLGTSSYSSASSVLDWKPTTFQYVERYIAVAYADNITGTSNFSFSPTNRLYFGLYNTSSPSTSLNAADYQWYLADPAFSTNIYLCYANRTNRKFSFDTGFANYAAGTGAFIPVQATIFDPRIWAALPNGTNIIDLDYSTGQVIGTGTTTVGTGELALSNSQDGKLIASLAQYLDFGTGIYQKTVSSSSQITIDIYGRVIGFEEPDAFYITVESFTATSGQTVFNVTRSAGYISGQCLVFQNGILQDTSDYTDTGGSTGTITFATGRTAGVIITIISFKSSNSTTGVYASFTRNTATLTNASSYTPSGFSITSGYEFLFLNGTVLTEQDYDIVSGDLTNFPSITNGVLTVIQWIPNNLTTPNGNPVNTLTNTIIGQTTYNFSYDSNAFNLYKNGVLLLKGTDYTTASGSYTLANTPTTNLTLLLQQTFARTGAV